MKLIRQVVYGLLVTLSLILGILIPNTARASSDYDNLLHTSPSLFVYTDGATKSQTMDIGESWFEELNQTYAKRITQNVGFPTNFMTELNDIRSSGGSLGVVMLDDPQQGITVEIIGSRDPNAYCGFVGDAITGSYQCTSHAGYGFIRATYFTHNSFGGNGCIGSWDDRCSNKGMSIYA